MAKRNTPNSYFAWYNDHDRIAIVCRQESSDSTKGTTSGEYDTFLDTGNLSGTITDVTLSSTTATYVASSAHGLATGDKVSISGTTNFNDSDLASQEVTVTSSTQFTMTTSDSGASNETSITASWTSLFVDEGIRLVIHSKYEALSAITDDLQTTAKLDSTMHAFVLDYVKSRVLEDMGQVEPSQYFRTKYENGIQKKPTRKSGVRTLLVPQL